MARTRERAPRRLLMAAPAALALCAAVGAPVSAEVRPIDGVGNNIANPQWGAFNIPLLRVTPNAYADGFQALSGENRPNPRLISNTVMHQDTTGGNIIPDPRGMTDYGWAWGQLMDHDIGLTPGDGPGVAFIEIPAGDPWYDPDNEGDHLLPFRRSRIVPGSGTGLDNPREQVNIDTAYIDASFVYGSDEGRATWLRTFEGGKLKFQMAPVGMIPPQNDGTQSNDGGNDPSLWVAGDERINETTTLACLHIVWLREHNRLAEEIAAANPTWTDEEIYQRARALVVAQVQRIHYEEFLPSLFGEAYVPPYEGYDPTVNPSVVTEFNTAAYRVGHTMLSPVVLRLDELGNPMPAGNMPLSDSFFNLDKIMLDGGLEPVFRGLAKGQMQKIDGYINDEIRIFLFEHVGSAPLSQDLISRNIQRGRDHGLPDYNTIRVAYGLAPKATFAEITSDPVLQSRLAQVYTDTSDIDPWVGMVCEDLLPGSSAGETITTIVLDQFLRCRDGDRFWYEINPQLSKADIAWVKSQKLSDVIIRNTDLEPGDVQPNLFFVACPGDMDSNLLIDGADLAGLLTKWGSDDALADLNGDGTVDGADLATMLTNWGSCH